MNDNFLRNLRRPPSATFERQLRARLREQELDETSRRRPSWKLLMIAMLVGGTALATATYLAMSRTPSSSTTTRTHIDTTSDPSSRAPAVASQTNRFAYGRRGDTWKDQSAESSAPPESAGAAAGGNTQATNAAASGSQGETTRYVSSTGAPTAASKRMLRVVVSPDIAALVKDTPPDPGYTRPATIAVDTADNALPTLCANESEARPHIVVTSRAARKGEIRQDRKRSFCAVSEAILGHIAIVVTRAKTGTPMQLSTRALRLALAKRVPSPDNSAQLIDNPYTHWNEIDPALEDRRIEVLGPASNTPEFLAFTLLVMAPACETNGSLDTQDCQSVREDGVYSSARFDANFVPQRLWSDPNVVAVMDYRFYAANSADLLGSLLPGAAPTRESILAGTYIGARTLRAYVDAEVYGYDPKVRYAVNEFLRQPTPSYSSVMIPSDGDIDRRWRPYADPILAQVKLD